MIVHTEDDDETFSTSTTNNHSNHLMHGNGLQRSYSIATGAQTISNKPSAHTSRSQSRHSFSSDTQVTASSLK